MTYDGDVNIANTLVHIYTTLSKQIDNDMHLVINRIENIPFNVFITKVKLRMILNYVS